MELYGIGADDEGVLGVEGSCGEDGLSTLSKSHFVSE
jgi:hypothetical protein